MPDPAVLPPPEAAFYQAFLDQSPVGILHLDAQGEITLVNEAARRLLGDRARAGAPLTVHPALAASLQRPIERLLGESHAFGEAEVRLRTESGPCTIQVYGSPVPSEGAPLQGAVLTLVDVTDQRRSESALRVQARYETAQAALRGAALDLPSRLTFLEATVRILAEVACADGVSAYLPSGDGALVRVAAWPPDEETAPDELSDGPEVWPGLSVDALTYVARDDGDEVEHLFLKSFGAEAALLVPFHEDERRAGLLLLDRDPVRSPWSTAEGRAIDRLVALFETMWVWIETEARYRRTVADIADTLFQFVHEYDGGRTYTFVTPQAEAVTGHEAAAILRGAVQWEDDLVHPGDLALFREHEERLRLGEESRAVYRVRRPDGTVRWVAEHGVPQLDPTGRMVVGGILTEVTEHKEAEAKLIQAHGVAERAARARMAFLSTMSHELRTPLGAIRGFGELLRLEVAEYADATGTPVPEVVDEFIGTIQHNAERALRLIGSLFDLTRLETGAVELTRAPVDLHETVEAVAERYRPDLEARGVAFRFEHAGRAAMTFGDPARIEQVVDHVLSNAAKFTQTGHVRVTLDADEQAVRLDIEDTGVGIAEAYLEGLFEPFSQEDYRLDRQYDGSGLGLAITKRLLDEMGGTIAVESVKGEGARFTITLPGLDAPAE